MEALQAPAGTSAVASRTEAPVGHQRFRLGLRPFLAFVCVAGLLSILIPATWTAPASDWLPAFLVLTAVSTGLEFVSVPLPSGGVLSVATITHVATVLLVPAPFAAVSVGLAVFVEEMWRRAPLAKASFNVAGMVLTVSLTSFVLGFTGSVWSARDMTGPHVLLLVPFLVTMTLYYSVNIVLTSVVISLASNQPVTNLLRRGTGSTILSEVGATTLGALFALIWTIEPVLTLLLAAPGAVISRSFEHIHRLESETRAAVRSMAEIVDHRDATTFHHSERVAAYAVRLARELRLSEEQAELIEQAASVHDLGKIGVPDRILLKPGPLTQAERTTMWLHTEIGAQILGQFQQFNPGVEIVLHHHESFDGAGYPKGLAGEKIPFGARIVAVADAFDAMTADRPYRAALPVEEAVRRLREGAGRQWDPNIVEAFLRLVDEGQIELSSSPTRAVDLELPSDDLSRDVQPELDHHGAAVAPLEKSA